MKPLITIPCSTWNIERSSSEERSFRRDSYPPRTPVRARLILRDHHEAKLGGDQLRITHPELREPLDVPTLDGGLHGWL